MGQLGLESFHRVYASTELGFVGVACNPGEPYSVFSDEYIFEIVDETGIHVNPGQSGRVLVTVLCSDAAPLIRYENGDVARYLGYGGPFQKFTMIDQLSRAMTAFICDAKLTYDDIANIPKHISEMGVQVTSFQLAKQRHEDGRDKICLRIETPYTDMNEVRRVGVRALAEHYQIDYHLKSKELAPTIVEVYAPGQLTAGRFKLPLFVDESNVEA
jgi:phenylacetate-coenzyme A ligase PaaK-like adenylate-forming protein